MESVNFPRGFLDSPEIPELAALSTEQKYVWSLCCLEASAAGVVFFSPTYCSKIGIVQSVARQIACELCARGLVVFDEQTQELFLCHWFFWQKTPVGEDKWSRQVTNSLKKVKSGNVKDAICYAIDNAPAERIGVVPVPSNLLSKLRHPTPGKRWAGAPSLLMLALYTWPTMGWAGMCVADYEALSTYIGASGPEQIVGHLRDLDRAGNVFFDYETGEIFYPTRLQGANPAWHMEEILTTRLEIVSHRLKLSFSRMFTRCFGKISTKSKTCALVDSTLVNHSFSGAAAPFQDDCWLKSETHPKTASALIALFKSAQKRNKKGSNEELDVARCRRGLEFAEKHLTDESAAAAITALFAQDGWPREITTTFKSAQQKKQAKEVKQASDAADQKFIIAANACSGRDTQNVLSLVGKTVRFPNGVEIVVSKVGVISDKCGYQSLNDLHLMIKAGELLIVDSIERIAA